MTGRWTEVWATCVIVSTRRPCNCTWTVSQPADWPKYNPKLIPSSSFTILNFKWNLYCFYNSHLQRIIERMIFKRISTKAEREITDVWNGKPNCRTIDKIIKSRALIHSKRIFVEYDTLIQFSHTIALRYVMSIIKNSILLYITCNFSRTYIERKNSSSSTQCWCVHSK